MLESYDAVVEEIVDPEPFIHPLVLAMQELREDGIIGPATEEVNEDTITLNKLYKDGKPDRNETIWDYGTLIWNNEYKIDTVSPAKLNMFLCHQYDVEFVEELFDMMSEEQHELVDRYIKDPNLSNQIIVLDDGFIVDGNHRAIAAALTKRPIKYIDLTDQEEIAEDDTTAEELTEISPDTLEGSFTPDLVDGKTWLCEKLAKGLKGKNVGTIYALGSWYGNIGIFLQQAGVKFNKLVLVEPDEKALMRSKKLLEPLNDDGKLILLHQNAEDIVYDKPGIIINTSCNETGPVFLTKVPKGMLCLLQARNNYDALIITDDLQEFDELFPLEKTYYTGKKELTDPETDYTRFMKIGRAGNALSETASTGQGGGSAGSSGGQMVGGPTTYEQEYDMFKSKGPRRIMAMTNETLDSSYPYKGNATSGRYKFETENGVFYIVDFQGEDLVEVAFSAILPGGLTKTTLTGTGNSTKVLGTVVNIVKDFLEHEEPERLYFTGNSTEPSRIKLYYALMSQVDKALPDYYADKTIDLGSSRAYMLKRKKKQVTEALDSKPYKYDFDQIGHTYVATFITANNVEYETLIEILGPQLNSPIEVIFNMINNEGDPSIGIENTGDARRVFATVIDIIKKYTSMNKPIEIVFSAKEPSRIRLYDAFIRRLDRELPKYELHTAQDKGYNAGKKYILKLKTER